MKTARIFIDNLVVIIFFEITYLLLGYFTYYLFNSISIQEIKGYGHHRMRIFILNPNSSYKQVIAPHEKKGVANELVEQKAGICRFIYCT